MSIDAHSCAADMPASTSGLALQHAPPTVLLTAHMTEPTTGYQPLLAATAPLRTTPSNYLEPFPRACTGASSDPSATALACGLAST